MQEVLTALRDGAVVALCSDAGTPLVSDPGSRLVTAALEAGFPVTTVPGPSAVLAALVVSGFAGRFVFEGFLARKGPERRERLEAISASVLPSVVFEAPGRVADTLTELTELCGGAREVAICRELTKLHEEVFRGNLVKALGEPLVLEPRGEYVLVISGAQPRPPDAEADVGPGISALIESGMSVRDAARAAEVLRGVPHRVAYDTALRLAAAASDKKDEHA